MQLEHPDYWRDMAKEEYVEQMDRLIEMFEDIFAHLHDSKRIKDYDIVEAIQEARFRTKFWQHEKVI